MTDDTTQDWPGTETWLCEGCDEPKPTDECWPCETDDGRLVLCPDCRDDRDVEPVVLTGGDAQCGSGTERLSGDKADVYDLVERKGPITLDGLMKQIGAYSRDEVYGHLHALKHGGYVVEIEEEVERGDVTFPCVKWSVDTGTKEEVTDE